MIVPLFLRRILFRGKYRYLRDLIGEICANKEQWYSGENVWLSCQEEMHATLYQAFLKNDQGYITLHVSNNKTKNRMHCRILILDMQSGFYGWRHVVDWEERIIHTLELNQVKERSLNASLRTYSDYVENGG